MSNSSNFSWDFVCPKYVDFADPTFMESNGEDAYFDREHEFSFGSHNLSDALKVESILAKAESMASPMTVTPFGPETTASPFIVHSPSRPESAASNYRTPEGSRSDLESDDVFYTTRKSAYSLRETECRRLKSIGASPYRIPGGTTSGKKKSRRTPFQPKLVEPNAQRSEEEEVLVQSLKKALFLDDDTTSQKDEVPQPCQLEPIQEKENSPQKSEKSIIMNVTHDSNDYSLELMTVSQDIVTECISNLCKEEKGNESIAPEIEVAEEVVEMNLENSLAHESIIVSNQSDSPTSLELSNNLLALAQEMVLSKVDSPTEVSGDSRSSIGIDTYFSACDVFVCEKANETVDKIEKVDMELCKCDELIESPIEVTQQDQQEEEEKDGKEVKEVKEEKIVPVINDNNAVAPNVPEVRISPQSVSSDEGFSKSTGGCNSDSGWTDVDDENIAGTSKLSEKRTKRPLRRESFVKSSATLASTVKKVDPQKRLYRLLSYTAPPRNKYRSLAELNKDFETKIRAYTPPNPNASKVKWTPTKPVSPKLTACKRKRTLTCVSHLEQEENIALSIKKNTFKATPFNKKTYLSIVNVGVKRVDPKPTTKPIPFSFQSDKRIEARKSRVAADLFNNHTSISKKTK